jgi:hypothetical protein
LCHGQSVFICVNPWLKIFRAGGIRTHDLLNPIQAFYQAELRPAEANTVAISGCEANVSAYVNESSHEQTQLCNGHRTDFLSHRIQ